jgi:hypothetical protein
LPSSIHELIVVPINITNGEDNDINMFRDMVCSINNDNVDLMDKLSDSVYKYIRAIKRVELA